MYIIFFLFSFLGLYSINYVLDNFNNDYKKLRNKYNDLEGEFIKYKIKVENDEKLYKPRFVNLRIEYAKFKINYKVLLNENLSLREENLELKDDVKNWTDKNWTDKNSPSLL
tara:strand:- start:752 stop:1087 length:336 start_codon:yes stop_codon:yes gene_type:complete